MAEPAEGFRRAREALAGLDSTLQHKLRLGILVLLADADRMSFSRLKELLGPSDGNLGAQLRKLEDAEYVSVHKEFVKRRPVSWYGITAAGREASTLILARCRRSSAAQSAAGRPARRSGVTSARPQGA